jgi:DNA-binding transcriptional MerR regulator
MKHVPMYNAKAHMAEPEGKGLTIDELARRTGMTVRNIRAHQSRGLLPPPWVVGRTGYYGEDHVARLELIKEMQGDGFNLGAIARLLEGVGDSSGEVLDFTRAVRAPFEDEQPEILPAAEIAKRWGGEVDPALFARAERLGLLRSLGDERYEVLSPRVFRAGAELADIGIPPDTALEVAARVRRHSREIARAFVELFLENVWKPFDRAGRPEQDWPQVREALERLRPLASEAMLGIFQLAMSEATESAFGRTVERQAARSSGRSRSRRRGDGSRRRSSRGRRR